MGYYGKIITKLKAIQRNSIFFWFSLIFLNILLFLPEMLLYPGKVKVLPVPPVDSPRGWYDTVLFFFRRENQDFFRLMGDFVVIVTVLFITIKLKWPAWIRRILIIFYIFLLVFNIYESMMILIFGEPPILYNDLLLLKGGLYLLVDISFTKKFFPILGMITGLTILLFSIPFMFQSLSRGFSTMNKTKTFIFSGILIWIYVVGMTYWFGFYEYRSTVQWVSPKLVSNMKSSVRLREILQAMKTESIDSTYYQYSDINLRKKPDIYVFMIESYGVVLLENEEINSAYLDFMEQFQDSLYKKDWFGVSNISRSPIFGGRSWLSVGSFMTGIPLKDQVIYSYLINNIENYPHLVRFLNGKGYRTFSLQPLNRTRPGYSLSSYEKFYSFDRYINFEDLDFDGPAFGFRNIPDQYSINYAHEKFLQNGSDPLFFFFITVSTHSPWIDLPPYMKDWRDVGALTEQHIQRKYGRKLGKFKETLTSRFSAGIGPRDYAEHIFYDLKVIRDFIIEKVAGNSVILIIGDHQPSLISGENPSFHTPVHVIARDTSLMRYFRDAGFRNGLQPELNYKNALHHEGIYSLLIRALAGCCGYNDEKSLPPYKPNGLPISLIK